MARRSMLLIVAVLIAALGTAMIVLYVRGIDDRATQGQELVEVLTATAMIEAGETVSTEPSTRRTVTAASGSSLAIPTPTRPPPPAHWRPRCRAPLSASWRPSAKP